MERSIWDTANLTIIGKLLMWRAHFALQIGYRTEDEARRRAYDIGYKHSKILQKNKGGFVM